MAKADRPIKPIPLVALLLLFFAVSIVGSFTGVGLNYSDFYRETIAEVGAIGLLWYWFFTNRKRQQMTITLTSTRLWLAGLFLIASVSIFWAVNPTFFISKYLLWLTAAAVVWLSLTLPRSNEVLLDIARSFALIAAYVAVIGLVQALSALTNTPIEIFMQNTAPAANFVNKNIAMHVIILSFPLIIFLLLFDPHKTASKLYYFLISVVLAYVFYTQARSAWLALILESTIIGIGLICYRRSLKQAAQENKLNWSRGHLLMLPLALLTLLILLIPAGPGLSGFLDVFSSRMASIQQDFSSYAMPIADHKALRYQIWEAALLMFKQNPLLGSGLGGFYHNLLTGSENYTVFLASRVHNDLLETGVEIGIIGLIALFGAIIGLLCGLYKLITQEPTTEKVFYFLIGAALAGSVVNMQFSFPYQMPVPLMIVGLYIGLILKASDTYQPKLKTITVAMKPAYWYTAISSIGVILVLILSLNLSWLGAMSTINTSVKKLSWKDPIRNNSLICHKSTVVVLFYLSDEFYRNQSYKTSLDIVDSIDQCISDTWLSQQRTLQNLNRMQRYKDALKVFEKAKKHAPIGIYVDHINQMITYNNLNDPQNAIRVYEDLKKEPLEYLIKERKTLRSLLFMALHLQRIDEAKQLYQTYTQYFPYDERFDPQITARFNFVNDN